VYSYGELSARHGRSADKKNIAADDVRAQLHVGIANTKVLVRLQICRMVALCTAA